MTVHHTTKRAEFFAHKLISDICLQYAHQEFENFCSNNNAFWQKNRKIETKARKIFVDAMAPCFINIVRQNLGKIIADPSTSEADRMTIADALIKDAQLPEAKKRFDEAMVKARFTIATHPIFKLTNKG